MSVDLNRLHAERSKLLEKRSQLMQRADAAAEAGDAMSDLDSATLAGCIQSIKELDSRVKSIEEQLGMDAQQEQNSRSADLGAIEHRASGALSAHHAGIISAARGWGRNETRSQDSDLLRSWLRADTELATDKDYSTLSRYGVRSTRTLELRTQMLTGASPGSNTIGKSFMPEFIRELVYHCNWLKIARVINTSSGEDLRIPKDQDSTGANAVGSLISEYTQDSEANVDFDEITLKAYQLTSGLVTASWELLQDSQINVQNELVTILAKRIARKLDALFTVGTGSGQMKGIAHGVGSTGIPSGNVFQPASSSALSFDDLIGLHGKLDPEYLNSKSLGWMMHPSTLVAIRKLKTSGGGDPFLVDPVEGFAPKLLGYPVHLNTNMQEIGTGNTSIIFGDWSQYIIRQVNSTTLKRSDDFLFDRRATVFVALARYDGVIGNPLGFVAAKHA